jgi:hypothetical protein
MKKTSAFFAILILMTFCSKVITGQVQPDRSAGNLTVDVADAAENAPITEAFVLVHSGYGKKGGTAKLTQNRRFEISLDPGVYDVFIAAPGFAPMCKTVEISRGKTTAFNARLLPDREHLQPSS